MMINNHTDRDCVINSDTSNEDASLLHQIQLYREDMRYKCLKNCFVISIIFYCNFSAINSLSGLATSLNHETVVALSVYTFTSTIGCYLSPVIVLKVGGKKLLLVFLGTSLLLIAMEFYPRYYTLIPTAVLAGISDGVAWTVQMMYCANMAVKYACITNKPVGTILDYFYGIFFVFFSLSQVTGNLISSTILGISSNTTTPEANNAFLCGAAFCPEYADNKTVIKRPEQSCVSILVAIYLCIIGIGIFITIFGLDKLDVFVDEQECSHKTVKEELLSPIKVLLRPNMLLLAMLIIFMGIEESVIGSDYNEAYITCRLGVSYVGYSMMCYGVCNAVGSVLSSLLGPVMGRFSVISTCLLVLLGALIFILVWDVQTSGLVSYFIPPCLFGISDGALKIHLRALVGLLFRESQEPAYGVFNMLNVFGMGLVYAYNTAFCTNVKLYIIVSVLLISYVLYIAFHLKTGRYIGIS